MATHDPSIGFGVMSIYVNGALAISQDIGANATCNSGLPIRIGQNFHGALDEVAVNDSVLTADQIAAQYAYQSAWFDKINRFDLILDNSAPTIDVSLIPDYVGTSSTNMFLTGADAGSQLSLIEYRIDGGAWQAATPDNDLTLNTDAWTFAFPASAPGSYLVEARATDNVGNVSSIGSTTVNVDGTAPNLSQTVPTDVYSLPERLRSAVLPRMRTAVWQKMVCKSASPVSMNWPR